MAIPTIDLQDFPGQLEKLRKACEEWGCFRVTNHNMGLALMAEMKRVVRSLLDLPAEIKRRNTDVIAGSGYMAPSVVNPLYEALGLYDMASSQAVHDFCSQLDASPHQREIITTYGKAIHGLSLDLAGKIAESLGLSNDSFNEWPCQFRINKYNFTEESVGSDGVQIHTDSGFLTVLQDDENVDGLQVMDKSGTFVPVDPAAGTLLVNLGDVAHVWSNGRFCNVKHRVKCNEATIRISIASFLLGPREAAVEAPAELVDSEHPRLYAPFNYEDYRKLRLSTKLQDGGTTLLISYLDSALKNSNAKLKIVVGHHTILSAGHHGNTTELVNHLLPILKLTNLLKCSQIQFVTSGGGSKAWTEDDAKQWNPKELKFYDVFGSVMHEWSISKKLTDF